MHICCQVYFKKFFSENDRNQPCLRRFFACPAGRAKAISSARGSDRSKQQQYIVPSFLAQLLSISAHFACCSILNRFMPIVKSSIRPSTQGASNANS
jgi:hypothetical protein